MEINVKSLKFDADSKLIAFIEKKVARIEKFIGGPVEKIEVTLENIKEGKKVKLQLHTPAGEQLLERTSDTFENSVNACVDAMKEKLTRAKEKMQEK